jgi:hypothetical protein
MKIESARYNDVHDTFSVSFDDGITIILNNRLEFFNMISTGLDSYFLKKGKWPRGKNLSNRVDIGSKWISKNKNRYKKTGKKVAKSEK